MFKKPSFLETIFLSLRIVQEILHTNLILLILVYLFVRDENHIIYMLLQVASGTGSGRPISPDPNPHHSAAITRIEQILLGAPYHIYRFY